MKFRSADAFSGAAGYRLLPLRFRRLPWDTERVFVSSAAGDWLIMGHRELEQVIAGTIDQNSTLGMDLQARNMIAADPSRTTLAPLLSQMRSRKQYLQQGPSLHIFVVSLRCHHTCSYCQVSRAESTETAFDLDETNARLAVERLFEWPSSTLTVEFQGGEPLLHFARVRAITEQIQQRNRHEGRTLRFVLASTLHDLNDDQLAFFREHDFQLSTSLDGPEWLHNANRPRPERDSYARTVAGIDRARRALGDDAVSALTTLTQRSLSAPREIVDEYRRLGFHSIFLRPLSPYGFARKTGPRIGYSLADFFAFYREALEHILAVNRDGYPLEEAYASLMLSQLFTPFSHGYVDLRSPTGAGLGAVVYDYDGQAYPSDEARMLAAMGDRSFALGHVGQSVREWLASPAMRRVLDAGVAEALPGCADCAFVPLCGADPIDHYARQGDTCGHRPSSDFCRKQLGFFDLLLERTERADAYDRAVLESWALPRRSATPWQIEAA
ncbi:His-Xaa-Ser system radical SAM maturase HxsB [Lysobacter niastensis]|uniref:His-Xaa-Ser system radical SAM maturase HxsB n=1 Tax=Lysobacter niastensis TaxID=380629 RepID=A0ABS0B737_9GAMM|nr:His-Xaa-Ser system radical SAM maturase HxsB [Lysobacter niastensis]MBF6024815.1 His-Xaa-Ser system radical SAM maturase HxsB [Lysobacter niastensis]